MSYHIRVWLSIEKYAAEIRHPKFESSEDQFIQNLCMCMCVCNEGNMQILKGEEK